jgi:hypothetical protein
VSDDLGACIETALAYDDDLGALCEAGGDLDEAAILKAELDGLTLCDGLFALGADGALEFGKI